MRGRNEKLARDIDLLQTREDVTEEKHCARFEEVIGKAKMAGAIWFKENTLRRHLDVAPSLEWFRAKNNDERSNSSDSESDDDDQA